MTGFTFTKTLTKNLRNFDIQKIFNQKMTEFLLLKNFSILIANKFLTAQWQNFDVFKFYNWKMTDQIVDKRMKNGAVKKIFNQRMTENWHPKTFSFKNITEIS